ncbi:MAG: hypothetical protein R6U51_12815 [Anaerolineales bacterium]
MQNKKNLAIKKYIFPSFLVLAVFFARLLPGLRPIDDAFITYRYARNILSGNGFAFNPGVHIQGTTTPLYTLLLSFLGLFTGRENASFPEIALLVNAFADSLTALIIWEIGKKLNSATAGTAAALFWAIAPYSVTFSIGGLETSLYILLLTASVYFYIQKKTRLAAFSSSLGVVTRPDGILLSILMIVHLIWTLLKDNQNPSQSKWGHIKSILPEIILFCFPLFLWFGFAWIYFGNPIPHSILAKSQAYFLPQKSAFIRFLQHFATPFMDQHTFGTYWVIAGLVLYPFLFIIGAQKGLKNTSRLWPWILYPWFYFSIFSLANPLIFRWYLTPPLLPYIFFIFIGLENITRSILSKLQQVPFLSALSAHQNMVPNLVIILPLILTSQGWTLKPDHGPQRPAPKMAWFKLELLYKKTAQVINEDLQSRPDSTHPKPILAAADVGVLGYYTDLEILDLVGLNSHEALDYYPLERSAYVSNYAVPEDLVLDKKPEYLVILEVYGRNNLLNNPVFLNQYTMIHKIETDIYGSQGMLVYKHFLHE